MLRVPSRLHGMSGARVCSERRLPRRGAVLRVRAGDLQQAYPRGGGGQEIVSELLNRIGTSNARFRRAFARMRLKSYRDRRPEPRVVSDLLESFRWMVERRFSAASSQFIECR